MPIAQEANVPYRWDLVTPAQLGTLRPAEAKPDLWFIDELIVCTAKVVARSGNGDLYFVGRSLDSMYDLLCGAYQDTDHRDRLERLPLSFALRGRTVAGEFKPGRISHPQLLQARRVLEDLGLSPYRLARRSRPVTFVDVVHGGSTFTRLFELIDGWIRQERESWPVIRQKLRFVGVTPRGETSPNTWRWWQHAEWTNRLPARAVLNVSLEYGVWSYLADGQPKLTRSFAVDDWLSGPIGPSRESTVGPTLAQALAIVAAGRKRDARRSLARTMTGEPNIGEPWLRALVAQLTAR